MSLSSKFRSMLLAGLIAGSGGAFSIGAMASDYVSPFGADDRSRAGGISGELSGNVSGVLRGNVSGEVPGHLSGQAVSQRYKIGETVRRDDVIACKKEALARKIMELGLAPENLGAIIENNACFYLSRIDHVPQAYIATKGDLLILKSKGGGLDGLYAIVER